MEQIRILDTDLIKLAATSCNRPIGTIYNQTTGKHSWFGCGARSCEKCGWKWRQKWQQALKHKYDTDMLQGVKITRALTLTTSYDAGYEKLWLALKLFWRNIRRLPALVKDIAGGGWKVDKIKSPAGRWIIKERPYEKLQYFGVVEYNQKHTQPHLHFILSDDCYIPQWRIRQCWEKAQAAAGFERIAYKVWIEQIRSDIRAYFFKYITKAGDGKDEIPRPENWQGRFVRYSRQFFEAAAPVIQAVQRWHRQSRTGDFPMSVVYLSRSYIDQLSTREREAAAAAEYASRVKLLNKVWMPEIDKAYAVIYQESFVTT